MNKQSRISDYLTKNKIIIYSDFDGTISKTDIGDEFFKRYGDFDYYYNKLVNEEINVAEYWTQVCGSLDKAVTPETFDDYVQEIDVDYYFKQFVEFCNVNEIPLEIISDGFDIYIKAFLRKYGLENIPINSNKLFFDENNKINIEFPYSSESCNCLCASCKRNIILTKTPPDYIIIYIGDGFTDYCAAEHSDIVFARKQLAAYCNSKRIPHYPFGTFFDIWYILNNLITKNKLKIRHKASILRKQAFETE